MMAIEGFRSKNHDDSYFGIFNILTSVDYGQGIILVAIGETETLYIFVLSTRAYFG